MLAASATMRMVAMVGVRTSIGYLFPLLPSTNARARHPKTTLCFLAVSFDLAVGCVIYICCRIERHGCHLL